MNFQRSLDYRYTVDVLGAHITPLAAVELSLGPESKARIHNISTGGIAVVFDQEAPFEKGEMLEVSLAIRERAFPLTLEVKSVRGHRLSCAFVDPSPNFVAALGEFLQPKFLGESLTLHADLSDTAGALDLVPGAAHHWAYLGENQTGCFVWVDASGYLLKILAVSRDLVWKWDSERGVRTGSYPYKSGGFDTEDIQWESEVNPTVSHYFADILLAWLKPGEGARFIESLLAAPQGQLQILFPPSAAPL